jgi:hypothetical protein
MKPTTEERIDLALAWADYHFKNAVECELARLPINAKASLDEAIRHETEAYRLAKMIV